MKLIRHVAAPPRHAAAVRRHRARLASLVPAAAPLDTVAILEGEPLAAVPFMQFIALVFNGVVLEQFEAHDELTFAVVSLLARPYDEIGRNAAGKLDYSVPLAPRVLPVVVIDDEIVSVVPVTEEELRSPAAPDGELPSNVVSIWTAARRPHG